MTERYSYFAMREMEQKMKMRKKRQICVLSVSSSILICLLASMCNNALQVKNERNKAIKRVDINASFIKIEKKADIDKNEEKFIEYFQKSGSPKPEIMAKAVISTKKPRLMAAIAVVETKGDPSKRYTGYKKRHHGAWQVNPNDWGPVSHEALAQALQAEDALNTFKKSSKGNLKVALNKYGGETNPERGEYADKILAELTAVPK